MTRYFVEAGESKEATRLGDRGSPAYIVAALTDASGSLNKKGAWDVAVHA
jgi:hypothetical protein